MYNLALFIQRNSQIWYTFASFSEVLIPVHRINGLPPELTWLYPSDPFWNIHLRSSSKWQLCNKPMNDDLTQITMIILHAYVSMQSYPIHVESEEHLIHITAGVLIHPLQSQNGLEFKKRDQAWWRLPHELVIPVVHVLSEDIIQTCVFVTHGCALQR